MLRFPSANERLHFDKFIRVGNIEWLGCRRRTLLRRIHDLFVHAFKDSFCVETKLLAELRRMARKANNAELRRAFEDHASQEEKETDKLLTEIAESDINRNAA